MIPPEILKPIQDFWAKYRSIIIIVIALVLVGYSSVMFLGKDNPIEEEVEKVIEIETGVKVDLTP